MISRITQSFLDGKFAGVGQYTRRDTKNKNETGPTNHCTCGISSSGKYHLLSYLQHSHTSAFDAEIAGYSSGTRFLESP
ncbi:hypothetical protein TNCV_3903051 [Trichonephila clavipes]|nr:hypothetical protein TNCV_3903051 [Trichonephila clavipes]